MAKALKSSKMSDSRQLGTVQIIHLISALFGIFQQRLFTSISLARSYFVERLIERFKRWQLLPFENVLFVESFAFLLHVVDVGRSNNNMRVIQIFQDDFIFIFVVEEDDELLRGYISACIRSSLNTDVIKSQDQI
jgi:hypothetical protein